MKNRHQIQPNELSKEAKVSLRTRIISAIIAIAIALPCALFGDVLFAVFIAFIEIVAIFAVPFRALKYADVAQLARARAL